MGIVAIVGIMHHSTNPDLQSSETSSFLPAGHGSRDIAIEAGYDFLTVWTDEQAAAPPAAAYGPPFFFSPLDAAPAGRALGSFTGYTYTYGLYSRNLSVSGLRRVYVSFVADEEVEATGFMLRYTVTPTVASPPPPVMPPFSYGPPGSLGNGSSFPGGGGPGYYPGSGYYSPGGGGDGLPLCDSAFVMHNASYYTNVTAPGYITNDLAYRRRMANMTGDGSKAMPLLPPLPYDAQYAGGYLAWYQGDTNCSWLFYTPQGATTTIIVK